MTDDEIWMLFKTFCDRDLLYRMGASTALRVDIKDAVIKTVRAAGLAEEARKWDKRELSPKDFDDAPEAVPGFEGSELISIRLPKASLKIIKEFARRKKIGYQVLIKQWLDDGIIRER